MICAKWKLVNEIGHGAYGVVYLAVGPDGEQAAVKVCRRDDVGDESYDREFRGAKLFKSIPPQEGLVRMRDLVETDWGFYTVLDLADDEFDGSSVLSELRRIKPDVRPEHYTAFVASAVEGQDTETVLRLYNLSRDNLYQIRKRLTAKLQEAVSAVQAEMESPDGR